MEGILVGGGSLISQSEVKGQGQDQGKEKEELTLAENVKSVFKNALIKTNHILMYYFIKTR